MTWDLITSGFGLEIKNEKVRLVYQRPNRQKSIEQRLEASVVSLRMGVDCWLGIQGRANVALLLFSYSGQEKNKQERKINNYRKRLTLCLIEKRSHQ